MVMAVNDFILLFMRAKNGEMTAVERLLDMYRPLLCKESIVNGIFDEDLYQELNVVFLKCVAKFHIR